MKNNPVFVPVFLYAVTMLIFQIKRIISIEKWLNYVVTFFFCKNAKNLGRSDDAKRRKKKDGLTKVCDIILHEFKQKIRTHELELDDFTFTLGYWLP